MAEDVTIIYPNQLPSALVSGYGYTRKKNRNDLTFDFGNTRSVHKQTGSEYKISLNFAYTEQELELFKLWYTHELDRGKNWFLMDLKIEGVYEEGIWSDELEEYIYEDKYILGCRIHDGYNVEWSNSNDFYKVKFSIEVKDVIYYNYDNWT